MTDNLYNSLNEIQIDALKEVTSIGAGNAATALSSLVGRKVQIQLPTVSILDFNDALKLLGGPETIVNGIMIRLSGQIRGIMLYLQQLDFINVILDGVLKESVSDYSELTEIELSALTEVGNITMSSYLNALSEMAGIEFSLSVPAVCVNMAGSLLSVPMAEYGYHTDKIMILEGNFVCDNREVSSKLLLVPDIESLKFILTRLGVAIE